MLHGLNKLALGQVLISSEGYPADLDPGTPVYVKGYPDCILDNRILLL